MKCLVLLALLSFGCASTASNTAADMAPDMAAEQHVWLEQLIGDWDVSIEGNMGPDETFVMETTETTTAFGPLWIVSESSFEMEGQSVASRMTLGYDLAKKKFVGTWVSDAHADLWIYAGQLDFEKKSLTLETKGPHFMDESIITRYRDVLEVTGPNTKRLTSTMEGLDGNWATFMVAEYTRKL